jgi:hypothetical protein
MASGRVGKRVALIAVASRLAGLDTEFLALTAGQMTPV